MFRDNNIVVQASIQPRTAFFAPAAACLKTGETIVIRPATLRGPEAVLALVESVEYEFADVENLGTTRGVLTILAAVQGGTVTRGIGTFPTFVGELATVASEIGRAYYGDVTPVLDSVRRVMVQPAALKVGTLLSDGNVTVSLTAAGFNRHTAIVAQSGAGKSYGLGVLLEELISKTRARIIVIDPNADFVGLRGLAERLVVVSSHDPHVYTKAIRRAVRPRPGVVILNFNALDQLLWNRIALELVETLWERRDDHCPTILVIDEAHHFGAPDTAATVGASKLGLLRFAAEGRKFGLVLMLATQRPQKIDANILTQCDNIVIMKLSSENDISHIAAAIGNVSRGMIELARGFQSGTALAVGKIVKSPTLFRFRERTTPEGGGDLSFQWCEQ